MGAPVFTEHVDELVAPAPRGYDPRSGRVWPRVAPVQWERKAFAAPIPKRKRRWRWDAQLAATRAVHAGVISLQAAQVFHTLLLTFSDASGKDIRVRRTTIGEWIHRSSRTVRRHIEQLEKVGFIVVEHRIKRGRDGTIRQLANAYRFTIPTQFMAGSYQAPPGSEDRDQAAPPPPRPVTSERAIRPDDPDLDRWRALNDDERAQRRDAALVLAQELVDGGMAVDHVAEALAEAGYLGPELVAATMWLTRSRAGP